MNREEWRLVEDELRNPYSCGALLQADGHSLKLHVERQKGLRFCIAVYVDGFIKGEWCKDGSEIGAKFYQRKHLPLFRPADVKRMEKFGGKRYAKQMQGKHPGFSYYSAAWPSVTSLRRHLAKTCTSIELVSCGYVPTPVEEQA